jgi:hypothetical protein
LVALSVLVLTPAHVHADTRGNTDRFEAGNTVGSPIYGAPSAGVNLRYGCTDYSGEPLIDANAPSWAQACLQYSSNYKYWHHGIDLDVRYRNLATTRAGTITIVPTGSSGPCSSRGIFAETMANGNVIMFIHSTAAPGTYQGQSVGVGAVVAVSGDIVPCGAPRAGPISTWRSITQSLHLAGVGNGTT